jgi:NADP-dependent 3-hydroxy acid dehydrogenase YdfG
MKTVFITGAAGGIGLATARHFASKGYFVGLYGRNQEALDAAMAGGGFPNACAGLCDVTSRHSIDAALADFATHTEGQLHILVNNAGVLSGGAFEDVEPQSHDLMIDVNVKGFTHVAQAGFPYLRDTPGACLVNLCSASSIHAVPNVAVYCATKFYVNGLNQALHLEWARHDIRVTCIKPTMVNTSMANNAQSSTGSSEAISLQPEDIAVAIDRAVSGNRISYTLGAGPWPILDKLLPESLRAKLVPNPN